MSTQTRRRADALLAAIRSATIAELDDVGYGAVTFEGVARRARTSKPVLYRRYRSRAHMVADALLAPVGHGAVGPSSGSLRADLSNELFAAWEQANHMGFDTYRAILGEADEELLAGFFAQADTRIVAAMRGIVGAARSRGELGDLPIPEIALLVPFTLFRTQYIRQQGGAPDFIDEILDAVSIPLLRMLSGTPTSGASGRPRQSRTRGADRVGFTPGSSRPPAASA